MKIAVLMGFSQNPYCKNQQKKITDIRESFSSVWLILLQRNLFVVFYFTINKIKSIFLPQTI